MPEAPFIEDDSGELWVRDGEVYIPDRDGLFDKLGCVALLHTDSAVMGLVLGKGWVPVGDLAKQAKQAGKPVLEAVK